MRETAVQPVEEQTMLTMSRLGFERPLAAHLIGPGTGAKISLQGK